MENLSEKQTATLSYKEWALTIFLSSIPLVGFILVLVWAFDSGTNIHKKNWAKGTLLVMLLAFLLAMLFLFAFGGMALLFGMNN